MITVTNAAVEEVKKLISKESDPELMLRLGVEGGGCSGLSYKLGFSKRNEGDKEFDFNGVKVVVDSKSYLYLDGITLDYTDGLTGKGFTFQNPSATRTCGCGSSFSA